jgi:hypothetical protein
MNDAAIKLRSGAMHAARRFLIAQRKYVAALRRREGVSQAGGALLLAYRSYDAALKSLLNHLTSAEPSAGREVEIELLKAESATLSAGPWAKIVRFGLGSHGAGLTEP